MCDSLYQYAYYIYIPIYFIRKHEIYRKTLSRCGAQLVNSFNSDYITDYKLQMNKLNSNAELFNGDCKQSSLSQVIVDTCI